MPQLLEIAYVLCYASPAVHTFLVFFLFQIANGEVDDDKKYVAEPADPSQFEWNPVARMYQRKQTKSDDDEDSESDDESEGQKEPAEEGEVPEDGSFDSDLKKRIDEQVSHIFEMQLMEFLRFEPKNCYHHQLSRKMN